MLASESTIEDAARFECHGKGLQSWTQIKIRTLSLCVHTFQQLPPVDDTGCDLEGHDVALQ